MNTLKSKPLKSNFSQVEAKQVCFNIECPRIFNLAAVHLDALQHKPSRLVAMYVIGLVSVRWRLAFGLSHINALEIEGSQIIAFLAYRPLTLPPRLKSLSPTPFFLWLAAGVYCT